MNWSSQLRNVLVALSLIGLGAPEAQAIEIYSGTSAFAHMNDETLTLVRGGRGGGGRGGGGMRHHGGGMHRGAMHTGMRGGMHRPGGGNINRGNINRVGGMHGGGMHAGTRGGIHPPVGAYAGGGSINRGNINRGNINPNVNRNRNVNRNVNRAGYGYRGGAVWAGRPGWYRWPAGRAIAAGAAIGWVSAASAYAWAGAPPQAGLCWYYTDESQHQGFWDVCP
jgi:hypothetical protein